MVIFNVPYIKPRRNRNGAVRCYWVRPGFKAKRLPDDERERIKQAQDLNALTSQGVLDQKAPKVLPPDQDKTAFAYWVRQFLASETFAKMAENTKRGYRREAEGLA